MLLLLLACTDAQDTDADTGGGVAAALGEVFTVSWEDSGMEVAVENSGDASWWFGMAETRYLDPLSSFDPWQGEDCFEGDLAGGGPVLWCHPIHASGTLLKYGGSRDMLNTGEETAMRPRSWQHSPVYYFLNILDGRCYIGGHIPERYRRLCSNTTPIAVRQVQSEIQE
jgi:hypothetical protein